ncbi:hypothetical protein ABZY34_13320 [Streptomyces virginiae]|uniref:hypothetical protein n=1 Tax=Streptomyces virginiae TaxID=1961 RepID=UPI0033AB8701
MSRSPTRGGWCLSAVGGGLLVWEDPDEDSVAPGEMRDVAREEIPRLFERGG